jgi:hypothetical protein
MSVRRESFLLSSSHPIPSSGYGKFDASNLINKREKETIYPLFQSYLNEIYG